MQDRPMAFNVTEYEKFIHIVSYSTLKLTFTFYLVWCNIKEEFIQSLGKAVNYVCEVWLSS